MDLILFAYGFFVLKLCSRNCKNSSIIKNQLIFFSITIKLYYSIFLSRGFCMATIFVILDSPLVTLIGQHYSTIALNLMQEVTSHSIRVCPLVYQSFTKNVNCKVGPRKEWRPGLSGRKGFSSRIINSPAWRAKIRFFLSIKIPN